MGTDEVTRLSQDITTDLTERASDSATVEIEGHTVTGDEAKAMLDAVRKRADGWRTGVAGTFTLVLASLAIKPGEGFMKYTGTTKAWLMILVATSLLCGLASLYKMVRAANGPTWLTELVGPGVPVRRYFIRAAAAREDLRVGQFLWFASVVLFSIAVAVTWFAGVPPDAT